MAGTKGADSVVDQSLLEGDDADAGDVDLDLTAEPDEDADDKAKADDKSTDDAENDIEVQLEEETEAEARARQKREEAADDGALERPEREGDEDEATDHGKKVKARIDRERRIARDANARADAANQRALTAQREALSSQKEAIETTKAALGLQIDSVKQQLVKAKEDGKTKDEVDLQEKLNGLQVRLGNVETAERGLAAKEEQLKRGAQEEAANPRADEWMRRNTWFRNPRFAEQSAIVRVIDRAMANAGWDKNGPEYFEELDRRIRRRIPEIARITGAKAPARDGDRPQPRDKVREPTGGVRRASSGTDAAPRKGKVTLTAADQQQMRDFGLDPTDPKHQREWASEKLKGGK